MTRGEAVNWIINISADIGKVQHQELWHYEQALSEIREMLEYEEPEQKWIPCSEALPEAEYGESYKVLVTCEWRDKEMFGTARWIDALYFDGGVWCYTTGETYPNRVVAWMTLPEPYVVDKDV